MRRPGTSILLFLVFIFCGVTTIYASFARVESMGKKADFFMDEISIFENPANINVFPNFLIGELGTYRSRTSGDSLYRFSQLSQDDPENSWFGGIFNYSLAKNKERSKMYPQISIGGAFNRKDEEILSQIPDSADGRIIPEPATNFDGFLGYTTSSGGMIGSHIYLASQQGANLKRGIIDTNRGIHSDVRLTLFRGDLGLNWPIGKNIEGEVSFGAAQTGFGPDSINSKWSFFVKARAFSTWELINGELVPLLNYSHLEFPGFSSRLLHLGLGANVSLDRGFFWLGIQGIFDETNTVGLSTTSDSKLIYSSLSTLSGYMTKRGVEVGFGIERNIWWDWLVLRVGGRKEITYNEVKPANPSQVPYTYFYTNPTGNGLAGDQIGFGIGVNIEEKLKVDATLAENVPYTFGNLFSGPHHHIISRISATYSF